MIRCGPIHNDQAIAPRLREHDELRLPQDGQFSGCLNRALNRFGKTSRRMQLALRARDSKHGIYSY